MGKGRDMQEIRAGEVAVTVPPAADATLRFIGRIHTPWTERRACPRQGDPEAGPLCRIEVFAPWDAALDGLDPPAELDVLAWFHQSRRDLVRQVPGSGQGRGTFALRSPVRPNPIGLERVRLIGREGAVLTVRGLDCLDGTPLLDIKPARALPGAG